MKIKSVFLLAGAPEYGIRRIGKELRKLGHHVVFWNIKDGLPDVTADAVIAVFNIVEEEQIETLKKEIKTELDARTGDNFVVFQYAAGLGMDNSKKTLKIMAKKNAEKFHKSIQLKNMGPDGISMTKKEFEKQIRRDFDVLMAECDLWDHRELRLLKETLLNIRQPWLRYLAMKYQKQKGMLMKRLLEYDAEYDFRRCKTVEQATEMLTEYLTEPYW